MNLRLNRYPGHEYEILSDEYIYGTDEIFVVRCMASDEFNIHLFKKSRRYLVQDHGVELHFNSRNMVAMSLV